MPGSSMYTPVIVKTTNGKPASVKTLHILAYREKSRIINSIGFKHHLEVKLWI